MGPLPPMQPPPVIAWYRVYCIVMALLYLACLVGGVAFILFADRLAAADGGDSPPAFWVAYGVILLLMGLVLAAAFLAALFLPRRPWVWVYHIVLICLGMTSGCFLPVCVPLLIFWVKPDVSAYFGR